MTVALEFRNVDILFCKSRGRRREADMARALKLLDDGVGRADIAAETGVVLGVSGASLSVEQGKISVLMGLSGSGKSTLLRAANGLNAVTRGNVLVRDGVGVEGHRVVRRRRPASHSPVSGRHGFPAVRAAAVADGA